MPKEETETKTKATRKAAAGSSAKEAKEKRKPSAYNVFVKKHFPIVLGEMQDKNPDSKPEAKQVLAEIAKLWKDSPENPNRGKEPGAKKAPAKEKKEKEAKPKSSKKTEEVPAVEPSGASEEGDEE